MNKKELICNNLELCNGIFGCKVPVFKQNKIDNDIINKLSVRYTLECEKYNFSITERNIAQLLIYEHEGFVTWKQVKEQILPMLFSSEFKYVEEVILNLKLLTELNLDDILSKIINENPEIVTQYKNGNEKALNSLVGKVMKETRGHANPKIVIEKLMVMI